MGEAIGQGQAPDKELEINLLGLLRSMLRRKMLFLSMILLGVASGFAVFKLLPKRFEAGVSFAFQSQGGGSSRLQQLAALAGNVNLRQEGSPFISHLEAFAHTREVTSRLRNVRYGDSTLFQILMGKSGEADTSDSAYGFHSRLSSIYELTKKDDVFRLSSEHADPEKARFLAQNIFDAISRLLEEKRRQGIKKKLSFIEALVQEYRTEYEVTAGRKKRFLMENLNITSPELRQKLESVSLQLKLDEEKYLLSVREQEELRIQYQQSEEPLVVLEEAFVPLSPIFPSKVKSILASTVIMLLGFLIFVGYRDRSKWIRIK